MYKLRLPLLEWLYRNGESDFVPTGLDTLSHVMLLSLNHNIGLCQDKGQTLDWGNRSKPQTVCEAHGQARAGEGFEEAEPAKKVL